MATNSQAAGSQEVTAGSGAGRPRVSVLCVPERDAVAITLIISGRQFNLNREKCEAVGKCLARIRQNALKATSGGKKKGGKREKGVPPSAVVAGQPELEVTLFEEEPSRGAPIPEDTPNEAAWERGAVLRIGDDLWDIDHNLPTVESIALSPRPLAGIPQRPSFSLLFTDAASCQWRWSRRHPAKKAAAAKAADGGESGWTALPCESAAYTPTADDVGCILRVSCLPARGKDCPPVTAIGTPATAQSGVVEAGPEIGPAQHRHRHTATPAESPAFRVVTYNILADQYVKFEKHKAMKPDAKRKEIFWYCPTEFLDQEYRRQLVAAELAGFNADIICLQEVDRSVFESYFQPLFGDLGFDSIFSKKAGKVEEGCALLVRRSRYTIADRKDLAMKEVFAAPVEGPAAVFAPMLDASPALSFALSKVGTVGQLALLRPADGAAVADGPLVVANTHLFFHPAAGHIRTMHAATIALEAAAFAAAHAPPGGGAQPAVVFCGDFNSDLNDAEGLNGAVQLLAEGRLAADHWEWAARSGFDWTKTGRFVSEEDGTVDEGDEGDAAEPMSVEEEGPAVRGVALELPCRFGSPDGLSSDFTNFVSGYEALLDYCWYERDRLAAQAFVPLPGRKEVEGWCPSRRWPSDHISVVADLRWRTADEMAASPLSAVPTPEGEGYRLPAELPQLTKALAPLMQDGVLAVPTDTGYGLACCANSAAAVEKICAMTERQPSRPLAICIGSPADVAKYGDVGNLPPGLLEDLLPGPTTIILPRLPDAPLSPALNPGIVTLGIRVPEAPFLHALAKAYGAALALTSAITCGGSISRKPEDVRDLWPRCNVVFDGGETAAASSTVLDLSQAGRFSVRGEGADHGRLAQLLVEKYELEQQPAAA